jgi:uncharacterized protein (DUF1778 family)
MPKTETLNLRVSPEFKKKLTEEAAREKRSVTNYLESTLSAIWESRELRKYAPTRQRRKDTSQD